MLLPAILCVPSTLRYAQASRERSMQIFTHVELAVLFLILAGAMVGVNGLATSRITI